MEANSISRCPCFVLLDHFCCRMYSDVFNVITSSFKRIQGCMCYILYNRPKSYNDKKKQKNVDVPYFLYIQYSCIMIWFYIICELEYKIQERFLIIPVLLIHTCWVILPCTSISVMLHLWPFVIVSRWWFPLFSTVWAEQWVDHQRHYYEAFEIITEIWPQVILVSHY